jgi:hypothetical protein
MTIPIEYLTRAQTAFDTDPCAAKAPCKSCPYRTDVPSGIWAPEEYDKLPTYDGEIIDQLMGGAMGLFFCHQKDGHLCAGWIATHGADNLLALRMNAVDASVWTYTTTVPVFSSGQDVCDHGKRDISAPGDAANRAISRLVRKANR